VTSYILRWFTHTQAVTHPSTNPAVHGRASNSQPVDYKSDAVTNTPPSMVLLLKLQLWQSPESFQVGKLTGYIQQVKSISK